METRINGTKYKKLYFKKSGKNLLDGKNLEIGLIDANGEEMTISTGRRSGFLLAYGMMTYSNSYAGDTNNVVFCLYDENKHFIKRLIGGATSVGAEMVFTFDTENAKYIRMSVASENITDASELQLEKGSVATPYEPYEPFVLYKKAYAKKSDKNLLKNTAVSQTINGVEFVVNADGSVTANGTNTSDAAVVLNINDIVLDPNTQYAINGCPSGGSSDGYSIMILETTKWSHNAYEIGNGIVFDTGGYTNFVVRVRISAGVTVSNLVFKPMIRRADIADDTYEPYEDWTLIYSAGNPVTYVVDTDTTYTEDVDFDASCLSPKTFTPSKDGYTFVGWREDTTASGDVLTSKVMGDEPVTLYAVFSKDVTLTTIVKGATSTNTKQGYYNNGNTANPTFTVSNPSISGATFKGWSTSASSTTVSYSSISDLSLSADTTLYAVYTYPNASRTFTIGYHSFPNTFGSEGTVSGGTYTYDASCYSKAVASVSGYCGVANYGTTGVRVGGTVVASVFIDGVNRDQHTLSGSAQVANTGSLAVIGFNSTGGSDAYISATVTITLTGKTAVG